MFFMVMKLLSSIISYIWSHITQKSDVCGTLVNVWNFLCNDYAFIMTRCSRSGGPEILVARPEASFKMRP
jgi:hypothetical protein